MITRAQIKLGYNNNLCTLFIQKNQKTKKPTKSNFEHYFNLK